MDIYSDLPEFSKRILTVYFLVDTSDVMRRVGIETLNAAIENVVPELQHFSEDADLQVKIAVLQFSDEARWMYGHPIEVEKFNYHNLETGESTSFGKACAELNTMLSRSAVMNSSCGFFVPNIFLAMTSNPTDDYKVALSSLKQNTWFKKANKVALAIGDGIDKSVLEDFTGNCESVLEACSSEVFINMISKSIVPTGVMLDQDELDDGVAKIDTLFAKYGLLEQEESEYCFSSYSSVNRVNSKEDWKFTNLENPNGLNTDSSWDWDDLKDDEW